MITNPLKDRIGQLLESNLFIEGSVKAALIARLATLTDQQAEAIFDTLALADLQQKRTLDQLLQTNPTFLKDLDQFTAAQIKQAFVQAEQTARIAEAEQIAALEAEISAN